MVNELLEFNVGEGEQPTNVQVPIEEENPTLPQVSNEAAASENNERELSDYSDKVKKRIDKLTARLRETQRREHAALDYAKQVQSRAQELEQRYVKSDAERLVEAQSRVETQAVALKQIIRKAREEGDIDTETEAQQRLSGLTLENSQIQAANAQREAYVQQQAVYQQQQQQQQQVAYQQQQQQVDPRVEEWAEKNKWYGRDTVMTHAAWGIHRQLIQVDGVDPSSDEYYDELDKRVRDAFPHKFQENGSGTQSRSRNVQTVAPASRSSGINNSARRTVRLTPSQVAIAKKLGVPLEEYAKYVKE
jgi:hypothetical protein